MPSVRLEDEEEWHDERGKDAVEVHLLRWRCTSCGASSVRKIDNAAKLLEAFLGWLLTRRRQADMPGGGRTFRRRASRFWAILPRSLKVEKPRGGHLRRRDAPRQGAVVLIASDDRNALGWHLARTESSRAWSALVLHIAAPEVTVSDGGVGLAKALRGAWPGTRHQRCAFHALLQARRYTTSRPRTQVCVEPYGLARALLGITALREADGWAQALLAWSRRWDALLSETSVGEDRRPRLVHERLVKARRSLVRLAGAGTLFTYLDPGLVRDGTLPASSNSIEGGVNARLRAMLRDHRRLSIERRPKAVFWWCYTHSPDPLPAAEILRVMPTDFGSCPPAAPSPRSTGGWTRGGGSRAPSRGGATPSCGRSFTTRSPTGWTGAARTHCLSYTPCSSLVAVVGPSA